MTETTLSGGPALLSYLRRQHLARDAEVRRWIPVAKELLAHHRKHGVDDQSVYGVDDDQTWKYFGPHADDVNRQLLSHDRSYVAVSSRDTPQGIALSLASMPDPTLARAHDLVAAADLATPAVAVVLACCVYAGGLRWDSGETIAEAARRLCLDAAWRLHQDLNPSFPTGRHVYEGVLDTLNIVGRPAAEYAAHYLSLREDIDGRLAEQGIAWGGETVDAERAAERAGIRPSTWRAHVSRGEAPRPDEPTPPRWRLSTVDAWRHTRPRADVLGW